MPKLPWQGGDGLISLLFVKTYLARRLVAVSDALIQCNFLALNDEISDENRKIVIGHLKVVSGEAGELELPLSEIYAKRLVEKVNSCTTDELTDSLEILKERFDDEIRNVALLYVPSTRAEYFRKEPESLLGGNCRDRFPSVLPEIDEAMKCYAVGRYTACAFHLMRASEAGTTALGNAIGAKSRNNNWGDVFKEYDKQLAQPPDLRPVCWATHGEFLEKIGANLRAVKVLRNSINHLDESYTEERTAILLVMVPEFIRQLAERMDDGGTLL